MSGAPISAGQAAGGRAGGAGIGSATRPAYQSRAGGAGIGSSATVPTQAFHEPAPGPGGWTAIGVRLEEAELPDPRIAKGAGSA